LWITGRYKQNYILTPADLTIYAVSSSFNVQTHYICGPTFADWDDDYSFIFLDNRKNLEEQRQDFFHEFCHPLRHVGDQESLPKLFVEMQEAEAAQFQLYAAMPFYMVEQIEVTPNMHYYILELSRLFILPYDFVRRRVEQIQRRIFREYFDRKLSSRPEPEPTPEMYECNTKEYSNETKRILRQLHQQVAEKQAKYQI